MRTKLFTAGLALVLVSACGSSTSSQAKNQSANAVNGAAAVVAARPLTKARALAVMHERHEGMEDVGKNNKVLRRELTAPAPNLAAVRAAAAAIARRSSEAARWFPAGTGPNVGKTGAKPEIWQKPQDFAAKMRNFQAAAHAFDAAAKSGDVNAVKARYATLGGTCKACHDSYRSEMHH
jgi:cytochrome c556